MVAVRSSVPRRIAGSRETHSVLIAPIASSTAVRWRPVNHRAIPAAVVEAGVGAGSNACPAASARRRSSPTR